MSSSVVMDTDLAKGSSANIMPSTKIRDIGYFTIEDVAFALSYQTPYSYDDCIDMLLTEVIRGHMKPADVRDEIPGIWTPIKDLYGDTEGWIHLSCGRTTKEASKFCPTCGAIMEPPKVRMTKGKKYD